MSYFDIVSGPEDYSMLELGALQPNNYASCSSWIQNHPIDLQSQHPDVLQQDFFERPMPESVDECFDVISCSLVLNFVSDPKDRGQFLYTNLLLMNQVGCCD